MLNGLKHHTVGAIEVPPLASPAHLSHRPDFDLTAPAALDPGPGASTPSREVDHLLQQGFPWLRFPSNLESGFVLDNAARRLRILVFSGILVVVLFNWYLLADALLVPDVFELSLKLRLFVFTPCTIVGLYLITRLPWAASREWLATGTGLVAAGVNLAICLSSANPLAGPYLVGMMPIVLFSNSLVQMRFFPALTMDALILLMFGFGASHLATPANLPVLLSGGITLASAVVFTLYGCYTLERDERRNWLLLFRERLLLRELELANEHLDAVSRIDLLTEVANRRHFDEYLQRVWEQARQNGGDISLMMIDVDHFKAYNDRYGHPEGDGCLKEVAATLKRRLRRPGDLIARFGGEEFIVILAGTPLATAASAAERVRKGVENLHRLHAASPTHGVVTVSIGVASVRPNAPHASPAQLIAAVDEALYQAKSRGRNRVFAFGTQD